MKTIIKKITLLLVAAFVTLYTTADDGKQAAGKPLRELAAKHNLLIGTVIDSWRIEHPVLSKIMLREFSSVTTEQAMKSSTISRGRNDYYFKPVDDIVAFAEKNKMKVRGHTLIWHLSMPAWLTKLTWTKDELLQWLKEYITTVVGRYKGRIYCWDVVNEVFEPNGKHTGELKSFLYKICGPEYIEKAFIWAHEADSKVKLYINDVSCEYPNRQSNAIYNWIKDAKARGIPVHGIGFQAHLAEETPISFSSIRGNFQRFKDLGLELQITEMDVRIDGPPTPAKLDHQAEIFSEFMKMALEFKMPAFTTWGVSDEDSWIPYSIPGYGSALLFDKEGKPKPAYFALQEVLASTPPPKKGK